MVARPDAPLENGTYEVQSTSVSADDGDIERVQWTFTVAVAASPSPTEVPSVSAGTSSPEATASVVPSASATEAPSPSPAPGDSTSDSSNVILPIIAALAIVAIGGVYLLNRNRGRTP